MMCHAYDTPCMEYIPSCRLRITRTGHIPQEDRLSQDHQLIIRLPVLSSARCSLGLIYKGSNHQTDWISTTMAGLGRSFKPPACFPPRSTRPPGPARTLSGLSTSSDLSPLPSPDSLSFAMDSPPVPRSSQRYLKKRNSTARSQPIAIELPTATRFNSGLPPAPLSARGEVHGGYFPLHEEHVRVYHHHPFHIDAARAHMESIQRASQDNCSDSLPGHSIMKRDAGPLPTRVERTMEPPQLASSSSTPIASYLPLGDHNSHLPVGRYYPTNYESRKDKKGGNGKDRRPSASATTTATTEPPMFKSTVSDSQMLTVNQQSSTIAGHARNESEAKRRLQQYQRDMVAQATLALNRGTVNQTTLNSIRSLGLANMAGPSKPRLVPLGSPGPVTPMDLENSDSEYIGPHETVESPNRANIPEEPARDEEDSASPR
ncbi:hypothetical protein GGR50DRAFT_473406 [Xylaria sp. CBS 124048]|nr:hypothetical protein GGR50DRAFT_473406 [Xylaria sp. CBS 124048]